MPDLELRRAGHTLLALIDRPPGNAFSMAMLDELADAVEGGARDPELRFVRVRARGAAFCTGRDRGGATPDELRAEGERIVRVNELLRTTPKVVVCEVQGDAAGFGVGLAAAADVTIAARSARFWFPELESGLAPAVVLSWLAHRVPAKRAFELVTSGRRIAADEAVAYGMVTEAVDDERVVAVADGWVSRLQELDARAVADVKSFLSRCRELTEPAAAHAAVDALTVSALRLQAGA